MQIMLDPSLSTAALKRRISFQVTFELQQRCMKSLSSTVPPFIRYIWIQRKKIKSLTGLFILKTHPFLRQDRFTEKVKWYS
jgi:hypothetical protein